MFKWPYLVVLYILVTLDIEKKLLIILLMQY